jgi:ornithine carbamoyltransferase
MHAEQTAGTLVSPHFLSILDWGSEELEACLKLSAELKRARAAGARHIRPLEGRHIALLFE